MFYNDFDSVEDVVSNYGKGSEVLFEATVIHADYTYEDYSGSSYVLYWKDGMFYEVSGSHCSCYGLEDQWEPEATTLTELLALADRNALADQVLLDLQSFLKTMVKS
jgi:hypothetical protein